MSRARGLAVLVASRTCSASRAGRRSRCGWSTRSAAGRGRRRADGAGPRGGTAAVGLAADPLSRAPERTGTRSHRRCLVDSTATAPPLTGSRELATKTDARGGGLSSGGAPRPGPEPALPPLRQDDAARRAAPAPGRRAGRWGRTRQHRAHRRGHGHVARRARDAGDRALAGLPAAAVVLGAALGATILAALMARRGRRIGRDAGYSSGSWAPVSPSRVLIALLPVLLAGSLLDRVRQRANQLSRYTAADMYPEARRASAIGTVVWAATVGAVIGPNLRTIVGQVAVSLGLPLLAEAVSRADRVGRARRPSCRSCSCAPIPATSRTGGSRLAVPGGIAPRRMSRIVRRPGVALAILALVVGQFVMVLIMTMTPLHMTDTTTRSASVGLVISAHTFGMFALAPLSGWLTDRFGADPTIYSGRRSSHRRMASAARRPTARWCSRRLFLLGRGWNLGFVAGSAMLSGGVSARRADRVCRAWPTRSSWSTAAMPASAPGSCSTASATPRSGSSARSRGRRGHVPPEPLVAGPASAGGLRCPAATEVDSRPRLSRGLARTVAQALGGEASSRRIPKPLATVSEPERRCARGRLVMSSRVDRGTDPRVGRLHPPERVQRVAGVGMSAGRRARAASGSGGARARG